MSAFDPKRTSGVSVVNSIQLAKDAESDDPLRDVGSLQNNFWDCRRSIPAAGGVGGRDPGVATTDHRASTRQAQSAVISYRRQGRSGLALPPASEGPRRACYRSTRDRGSVAPGCLLRRRIPPTRSLAWHSRSSDLSTLTLAERICGAPDRLDPPGMPRPYCCDRRATPAPHPHGKSTRRKNR